MMIVTRMRRGVNGRKLILLDRRVILLLLVMSFIGLKTFAHRVFLCVIFIFEIFILVVLLVGFLILRNHSVFHDSIFLFIVAIEGVEFLASATTNLERFASDKVNGVLFDFFEGDVFYDFLQILCSQLNELEGATLLCLPRGRQIDNLANPFLKRPWQCWFNMKLLELNFECIESLILGGNF
jgi:hypothetical protein